MEPSNSFSAYGEVVQRINKEYSSDLRKTKWFSSALASVGPIVSAGIAASVAITGGALVPVTGPAILAGAAAATVGVGVMNYLQHRKLLDEHRSSQILSSSRHFFPEKAERAENTSQNRFLEFGVIHGALHTMRDACKKAGEKEGAGRLLQFAARKLADGISETIDISMTHLRPNGNLQKAFEKIRSQLDDLAGFGSDVMEKGGLSKQDSAKLILAVTGAAEKMGADPEAMRSTKEKAETVLQPNLRGPSMG